MTNKSQKKYFLQMPDFVREFLAEFVGTFIQMFLGLSSIMLMFIMPSKALRMYRNPVYANCAQPNCSVPIGQNDLDPVYDIQLFPIYIVVIGFTWASGTLGALMVSIPISGGYHNPGISISLVTLSRLHWKKLFHIIPAQYIGCFVAAAVLHLLYYEHISEEQKDRIIGYVMIPSPHPRVEWLPMAFMDGFLSCVIFSMFIFAVLDVKSNPMAKYFQPLLISVFIFTLIMFFSINKNGVVFNPARDLGTRLYGAFVLGFKRAFEDFSYCFWISQQISLTLGYVCGAWIYLSVFGSFKLSLGNDSDGVTETTLTTNVNSLKTDDEKDIPNKNNVNMNDKSVRSTSEL